MAIIVFARAPRAGQVKTRLIPALGADGAARLHTRLVTHTLREACAAAPGDVSLHGTPDLRDPALVEWAQRFNVPLLAQCEGDIGARMAHALAPATREAPLLLVGTDSPWQTAPHLTAALRELEAGADAVLGPVADGGYALIGLARFDARLFAGIDWSTERVVAQTRERLAACGLRWHEMPTLQDVDRPEDLAALARDFPDLLPASEHAHTLA